MELTFEISRLPSTKIQIPTRLTQSLNLPKPLIYIHIIYKICDSLVLRKLYKLNKHNISFAIIAYKISASGLQKHMNIQNCMYY